MDSPTAGRIPAFYHELYEILCPSGERIDRETFTQFFQSSSMHNETLKQIWDSVESFTGYVTRDGFYKALALIALSSGNKEVNVRLIEDWENRDCSGFKKNFPVPNIGSIAELKTKYQKMIASRDPLRLSCSFTDISEIDTITVDFAERKGMIFKHQEYKVTSLRYGSTVYRRYSDFDAFREYLIQRFPYRVVPALPPKSAILSNSKMERRKKQLYNFLSIVSRHPAMCDDSIVRAFLVFAGSDVLTHYKYEVERIPDEFMTNELAPRVRSIVHGSVVEFLSSSNGVLREITRRMTRIVETLRSMVSKMRSLSNDVTVVANEFRTLSGLRPATFLEYKRGGDDSKTEPDPWSALSRCLLEISDPVQGISEKEQQQALASEEGVLSVFEMFLNLLEGYEALLQRLEKGVAAKHKQAITRMASYKKRQISATTSRGMKQDETAIRNLEQRIIEQDRELSDQENRVYFSQLCQLHEIQLVYKHVELVHFALYNLVKVNAIGHSEIAQVWKGIQPIVEKIVSDPGFTNTRQSLS